MGKTNRPEEVELNEAEAEKAITKELETAVRYGKIYQELEKLKGFKELVLDTFIDNGLDILWENKRRLGEAQMMGKGSDKNQEILELLDKEIAARLTLKQFFGRVMDDANIAAEELAERGAQS